MGRSSRAITGRAGPLLARLGARDRAAGGGRRRRRRWRRWPRWRALPPALMRACALRRRMCRRSS